MRAFLAGAASAAVLAGIGATGSPGAASSVVVSMDVASATSITNQCRQSPAWNLGIVQPGTPATTATDANVCRIRFSSSNDSSALRLYQSDRDSTAMARADTQWDMRDGDLDGFHSVDVAPGGRVIAVGARGNTRTSSDSGASFPIGGPNAGGTWNTLDDVDIVDAAPNVAWASGHVGVVLRTADAGATWADVSPGGAWTDVFWTTLAIDASTAFVAGEDGALLRTTNSGGSWSATTSNTTNALMDFGYRAANDMWVVGNSNTVRRSTDGGNTWVAPVTAPPWSHWYAISLSGTSTIWLAGYNAGHASLARSTDNGSTWTNISTLSGRTLEDIRAISDTEAWAVGRDGTLLRTTDGGSSWTASAPPSTSSMLGIERATDGSLVIASLNEELHRTTDGVSFTTPYDGSAAVPLMGAAIDGADRRTIVAVGDNGTVRRSTDRGTTWATVAPVTPAHLRAVSLANGGAGWAVGSGGVILRTTDAGATWATQTSPTSQDLQGVVAVDERVGWAVGTNGRVLRTTDGGSTWTSIASGTSQHLWAITALDASTAWIGGNSGRIRATTNGGSSWSSRDHADGATVYQLHAVSATTVYAATDWPGISRSTDGGSSWVDVEFEGGRKAMAGLDDRVVAFTANWGATSYSPDQGSTWASMSSPGHYIHGRGLVAIDANRYVLVGENGTISVSRTRTPIPDFGAAGSTWASPASGLFGACLQDVGAGTTPTWTTDTGNVSGRCEPLAGDAWNAVPQAPTTIATSTMGTDAYVDLVWGVRTASGQAAGSYNATVTFEAIAPAA